ncbi:acyl-CoA dehydrogenase family protein [Roseixanthobacter glucoisosaccharinicivorans]|uniref:acyl-CoA dehydrogenase family protein n=1 Tax=Roseixanthobacter glucoisosaccharinicivorans TaxID=3119923 RepID=UPI0037274216
MLDINTAPAASGEDDFAAILLEQTDRLLAHHVTPACLKAADDGAFPLAAWDAVSEAGLTLALVSEEAGGAGLSAVTAGQIIRRSAYHALPAPLAETLMAQALWTLAGGAAVDGMVTLATGTGLALSFDGEGAVLNGSLSSVPWGAQASFILLAAHDGDGTAHLVLLPQADRPVRSRQNVANEPRDSLTLAGVRVDAGNIRPLPASLSDADGLMMFGAFLRAQQMVGAMERCLDLALTYANERKQFGKPIGRFQAVQHMLAEAAGQCAAAGAAAQLAASAWGGAHFPFAVAVAKARCGEAAGKVAEICHQVHGAMGFTHEHPLHFFTRRLWAWRDEFGREAHWQERIGRAVCGQGGDALWPMLVALRPSGAQD